MRLRSVSSIMVTDCFSVRLSEHSVRQDIVESKTLVRHAIKAPGIDESRLRRTRGVPELTVLLGTSTYVLLSSPQILPTARSNALADDDANKKFKAAATKRRSIIPSRLRPSAISQFLDILLL